ncbi:unnamed protein product [Coffea canephora]|uniref:Uncharacterized protein n=1 Tax=Coffea canephora TaxID=49390 RepID=A0A068UG50_COFCA|nr:unnamed protein product [Coffea canephora]
MLDDRCLGDLIWKAISGLCLSFSSVASVPPAEPISITPYRHPHISPLDFVPRFCRYKFFSWQNAIPILLQLLALVKCLFS